jgi:DNA-binding NarL/FixJ family response regulator
MRQPLQVYIVEDSPIVERLLAAEVVEAGAEVSGCSADAETAIGEVFALEPDVVLIDIDLKAGTGFEVLRVLQEQSLAPDAIKIVLTSYANPEYRDLSIKLGADRFFDKSSETPEALALIDALAGEGRSDAPPPRRSSASPA